MQVLRWIKEGVERRQVGAVEFHKAISLASHVEESPLWLNKQFDQAMNLLNDCVTIKKDGGPKLKLTGITSKRDDAIRTYTTKEVREEFGKK